MHDLKLKKKKWNSSVGLKLPLLRSSDCQRFNRLSLFLQDLHQGCPLQLLVIFLEQI